MEETGGLTTAYESLRLYGPYVLLTIAVMLLLQALFGSPLRTGKVEENKGDADEDEERDPPRNFSPAQLRRYTGVKLEGSMDPNAGKIFVSINRNVYDVTSAPQFYGPGANYECFAGRDASRALAKLSFAEEDLNNLNTSDLSVAERDELSNWETRFGGLFSIENFAVLGNSSQELKDSLDGYTTDFRTLEGGFHRPAEKLGKEIFNL